MTKRQVKHLNIHITTIRRSNTPAQVYKAAILDSADDRKQTSLLGTLLLNDLIVALNYFSALVNIFADTG